MPEVARVLGLIVGDEPIAARPLAHRVTDRVTEIGRQPALLDLEHLVPASRPVKTECRPVLELRERVLELVAVMEDLFRGQDRLERRFWDSADASQRVRDLRLLCFDLGLVGEILETATAAGRIVEARSVDA